MIMFNEESNLKFINKLYPVSIMELVIIRNIHNFNYEFFF